MYLPKEKEATAMNKNLEKDYEKVAAIKAAYNKAQEAGDEAGMDQARKDIRAAYNQIEENGEEYARVYRMLEEARERENDLIDINDNIWSKDVEKLIGALRENGIKEFTFSSTWSSIVETAWLFTKNGCSLKGMVEINGHCQVFMGGEWERKPAFLFTID